MNRLVESKKQNMTYIEYNKNIILINTTIESCYGSVIEQAKEFKNRILLYHNDDYYERKSEHLIEHLIKKKMKKSYDFKRVFPF